MSTTITYVYKINGQTVAECNVPVEYAVDVSSLATAKRGVSASRRGLLSQEEGDDCAVIAHCCRESAAQDRATLLRRAAATLDRRERMALVRSAMRAI